MLKNTQLQNVRDLGSQIFCSNLIDLFLCLTGKKSLGAKRLGSWITADLRGKKSRGGRVRSVGKIFVINNCERRSLSMRI